jgi:hypothetical protein
VEWQAWTPSQRTGEPTNEIPSERRR